jgi:hypothetical protein
MNTGHASKIAATELGLNAITNVGGTIYASNAGTNQIVTLNLSNGATTFVSNIAPSAGVIGGMAPVPEPLSALLGSIGIAAIAGFGLLRRRDAS